MQSLEHESSFTKIHLLFLMCTYTDVCHSNTMDLRWVNKPKRDKSKEIPLQVWDAHKADIIAQFERGGIHGVKVAREWILAQKYPNFEPT
jgi:hypothetical protein